MSCRRVEEEVRTVAVCRWLGVRRPFDCDSGLPSYRSIELVLPLTLDYACWIRVGLRRECTTLCSMLECAPGAEPATFGHTKYTYMLLVDSNCYCLVEGLPPGAWNRVVVVVVVVQVVTNMSHDFGWKNVLHFFCVLDVVVIVFFIIFLAVSIVFLIRSRYYYYCCCSCCLCLMIRPIKPSNFHTNSSYRGERKK